MGIEWDTYACCGEVYNDCGDVMLECVLCSRVFDDQCGEVTQIYGVCNGDCYDGVDVHFRDQYDYKPIEYDDPDYHPCTCHPKIQEYRSKDSNPRNTIYVCKDCVRWEDKYKPKVNDLIEFLVEHSGFESKAEATKMCRIRKTVQILTSDDSSSAKRVKCEDDGIV
jgi:hypothetical protein